MLRTTHQVVLNGTPLELPVSTATSMCLLGSPGTGKTLQAEAIGCATILTRRRVLVGYLDLKGDEPAVARTFEYYARRSRRPFAFVSTEAQPSHALNLPEILAGAVEWTSSYSRTLVQSLGVGGGLTHQFYEGEAAASLDRLIALYRDASTFERLYERARNPRDRELYPTPQHFQNVAGLLSALREFASVPQFNVSSFDPSVPSDIKKYAVQFGRMLSSPRGAVFYFRFRRFFNLVPLVLKALYEAVRQENGRLPQDQQILVLLFCDELHRALRYAPDIFSELIALSRAVSLVPAFILQNYSQVRSVGGDALVSELLDIPVTFYFGSTDKYSVDLLRDEWCTEEILVDPETQRTSYLRLPRLRESVLEWLSTSAGAKHHFLARVARAGRGYYTLGRSAPPVGYATYRRLSAMGWPGERGDLPGAVVPSRTAIFSDAPPPPPAAPRTPPERDKDLEDLLGGFA